AIYLVEAKIVMRWLSGPFREVMFAATNLVVFYWLYMAGHVHCATAAIDYLCIVLLQYGMMRAFADKAGRRPWLAFFTPIGFLVLARYLPLCLPAVAAAKLDKIIPFPPATYLVGISYLAFRTSLLVLEVRNGRVKRPGLWEYLGYCFFVPTALIGPINAYSNYRRGFENPPPEIPAGRALMRILVGLVKYQFLSLFFNRLTFERFLLNEHPHHWIDLGIASVAYYIFMYLNFSGFCDMVIGAAGLLRIPVAENFNDPMLARNVKEYWNRWHMTLSGYMRDVVFAPLSKYLAQLFGPANVNHAIAVTIMVVFLLIGIWHGVGLNYALFGVAHGVGLVINHYYTIALKKRLGRDGFKAYNSNRWIQAAATVLTFLYVSAAFFLFANTVAEMKTILGAMR
ncbi:MAG TPA: MBOAT family O-acyltransferase, partial [Candidatus Acidoferrales bacterium]|nr:MBOAT family O-acyltransferase [Candidatus Acidoferrales bacterium]